MLSQSWTVNKTWTVVGYTLVLGQLVSLIGTVLRQEYVEMKFAVNGALHVKIVAISDLEAHCTPIT